MLKNLHITNYALIDNIDIVLEPGLNILTGETGAGKSIILGALSLLLGGRADTKAVRHPDAKSVIEASFTAAGCDAVKRLCEENSLDWDNDTIILRREISPNGRSRAFVNDTPVNLTVLNLIALQLIDIHSQHQNLLLASPPYQLQVIDSLADNAPLRQQYAEAFETFRAALKRYRRHKRNMEQARDDEEFMRYQYKRLDQADLSDPDETATLEKEQELLSNIDSLKRSLAIALSALTDSDVAADSGVRTAIDELDRLEGIYPDAPSLAERLESVRIEIQDIADSLGQFDRSLASDPARLEEIDDRLTLLYDLQRRFKADSTAELIEQRNELRTALDSIEHSDETLKTLEQTAKRAKREALAIAAEISATRRAAAERFAAMLSERAVPLGMKNLRVEIAVTDTDMSATGTDAVEFLFAFNKNQPLLPVGNTASGGEISRLMLCIKSIVADRMQLPTLVFDEVDTGVSGDVANRMGQLMRRIAQSIQVIAITHLPQVAALGQTHFSVYKEDTEANTVTRISRLTPDQRVEAIARMLSGSEVDDAALANARSLLGTSPTPEDEQT